MTTYDRIERVLTEAGEPLAPHEFFGQTVRVLDEDGQTQCFENARTYVGCSESSLKRRMCEMTVLGRLTARLRDGKRFKEFSVVV